MFDNGKTTTLKKGFEYIKKARGEKVEVAVGFKYCNKCKVVKAVSEFNRQKKTNDGLNTRCKECRRVIQRKWREENPERVRESTRKWNKENPEKVRESTIKWQKENPEKFREYNRKSRQKKKEQQNADTITDS